MRETKRLDRSRRRGDHGQAAAAAMSLVVGGGELLVGVGDEDCLGLEEGKVRAAHLLLGAFSAVNQKQAPLYGQYLGAWIFTGHRQG